MDVIRLKISGIAAAGTPFGAEAALREVAGVLSVHADPAGRSVEIHVAPTVTAAALIAAVERAGYVAVLAG
jgi:copper chaperone CopZ